MFTSKRLANLLHYVPGLVIAWKATMTVEAAGLKGNPVCLGLNHRAVDKFFSLGVLTFTTHKQLCAVAMCYILQIVLYKCQKFGGCLWPCNHISYRTVLLHVTLTRLLLVRAGIFLTGWWY